jgi:hypothetical protein
VCLSKNSQLLTARAYRQAGPTEREHTPSGTKPPATPL